MPSLALVRAMPENVFPVMDEQVINISMRRTLIRDGYHFGFAKTMNNGIIH